MTSSAARSYPDDGPASEPAGAGNAPGDVDAAARLAAEIEALVGEVEQLRKDRDADRVVLDDLLAELARRGLAAPPAETVYPTWTDWVDHWLIPRISRSPHRYRWCHHYADHPEVADRLEALWHTWETQWPEPASRLAWYRDGLDHHWPLITAGDGPP